MSGFLIGMTVGFIIGGIVGFFIASLVVISRNGDEGSYEYLYTMQNKEIEQMASTISRLQDKNLELIEEVDSLKNK